MDFNYTEEQDMLRTMARDFLTDKCPKTLVKELEEDEKGYSEGLWNEEKGDRKREMTNTKVKKIQMSKFKISME